MHRVFFYFVDPLPLTKYLFPFLQKAMLYSAVGLGGGRRSLPLRGSTFSPSKGYPPLLLIRGKQFRRPARKVFYRRLWRQCILILKKRSRQKDYFFLSNCFQKLLRNSNFDMFFFFQKHACGVEILST